jgi:hypothetical protein
MTSPLPFDSELAAVWPRQRRFANALARDSADADDLAQMTAEKAFKSFDQFHTGTRFDSWIFRIAAPFGSTRSAREAGAELTKPRPKPQNRWVTIRLPRPKRRSIWARPWPPCSGFPKNSAKWSR